MWHQILGKIKFNLNNLLLLEIDINFLMRQALTKVSFLPFAFSLELWRYEVLENKFNSSEYNDHWWQLRLFMIHFVKMNFFINFFINISGDGIKA